MTAAPAIVLNVLREAAVRRWLHALALAVTLGLVLLAAGLDTTLVGGVASGVRLFGRLVQADVVSADVAVKPFLRASAYAVFYGCAILMCVATADIAPSLLAPGRVEQLLALPVRRWELVIGVYLGVLILASIAALYAAIGVNVILGWHTGIWSFGVFGATALALLSFSTQYAAMVVVAVVTRSTVLSIAAGLGMLALGVVAGVRDLVAGLLDPGVGRSIFLWLFRIPPPSSALAAAAGDLATGHASAPALAIQAIQFVFAAGALMAIAVAAMHHRDY